MQTKRNFTIAHFILFGAVLITLIATPFVNKDSLIIPKMLILLPLTLSLIPSILFQIRRSKRINPIIIVAVMIFIQIILIMLASNAPLEQQIYGRTGRGLGLLTWISYLLIIVATFYFIRSEHFILLLLCLYISGLLVSVYAIFQSFGLDFFPWDSKTNGVISTLGNPNFVSSYLAFCLIPSIIFAFVKSSFSKFYFVGIIVDVFAMLRSEALQGLISALVAISTFLIIYFYFKNKLLSLLFLSCSGFGLFIFLLGSLNIGPLAAYLYKISIQSRGDFWRSALNLSGDFPWFGVGLDSFGDYYLRYRDEIAVSHPWAEFTDSAHNYFLDYLVTGGFPFLILMCVLNLYIISSFFLHIKNSNKFDSITVGLFACYIAFLMQSIISPISIPIFIWSGIVGGALIGQRSRSSHALNDSVNDNFYQQKLVSPLISKFVAFAAALTLLPLFNADRLQFSGMKAGKAEVVISSAESFPRSVSRYSVTTRSLLSSGLNKEALKLARSAVKFNPNAPALWVLIMVNPEAPDSERLSAKQKLLFLDPLNQDIINYEISS